MRIFLDIGAHVGETVLEVQKPEYGFDRIVCFEPASVCLAELQRLAAADPRVEICPFGLGARNEKLELHNPGEVGASVLATEGPAETVEIVDAAQWFRANTDPADFLVVKTNCEGAEVDIINRLLDEGLLNRAVTFLITFDVRMFPEHRHKEAELRRRLRASGLSNYCFSDQAMIGSTHQKRIAYWLGLFGVNREIDRPETEARYADNFRKYSRMSSRRQRVETVLKERFAYDSLPEPAKRLLRGLKRLLGFSRERDVA